MSHKSITYLSQRERYLIEVKLNTKENVYQIANTSLKNKVSYGTTYNHLYYLTKLGGKKYHYLYNKHKKRKKQTKLL